MARVKVRRFCTECGDELLTGHNLKPGLWGEYDDGRRCKHCPPEAYIEAEKERMRETREVPRNPTVPGVPSYALYRAMTDGCHRKPRSSELTS